MMNSRYPYLFLLFIMPGLATTPLSAQFTDCISDIHLVSVLPVGGNTTLPISDGSGGAFFHFLAGDGNQLEGRVWCQRISADGYRMWGDSGRVGGQGTSNQYAAAGHADGKGGYYISWTENRFNGPYQNRFIQHLDAAGNRLWNPAGLYAGEGLTPYADASACTLSDGSMAIAVNGNKNDNVIFLQVHRYLSDSTLAWTAYLDTLSTGFSPKLVPDDAGGLFVSWQANDGLYIQHIDSQGHTWPTPKFFTNAAYYWCYSKPNHIFVGSTQPAGIHDVLIFQRYDLNGIPEYFPPGKTAPVIGYVGGLTPTQSGGFYLEHQSHISKIASDGSLAWQTTLPNGINQGLTSFLLEPVADTMVATYSGNGMIAFNTSGQVIWTKVGNPVFSNPFGLTGACTTTDRRFITSNYDPNGGPQLFAYKWNPDGSLYSIYETPVYTLSGPDSLLIGSSFTLEFEPDSLVDRVHAWLISTDGQNFQPILNSAQQAKMSLPLLQNTWVKIVVRRGMTCFDTIGPKFIKVIPLSGQTEPFARAVRWKIQQNGSDLLIEDTKGSNTIQSFAFYALDGRAILSDPFDLFSSGSVYRLRLPALPAGVYVYRISGKNGVQTGKLWIDLN